jgi:predicted enzyme related to lactoylglutathione lyase
MVTWFEIPAVDFDRAVAFYGELFEVELRTCDCGEEQMAFFPEQDVNVPGMISRAEGFEPSADGVVVYFDAAGRLEELADKTVDLGGRVLVGPTEIDAEGRGSFALLCDTEGNRFGLYAP